MWTFLASLMNRFLLLHDAEPRRDFRFALAAAAAVLLSHLPSPAGAQIAGNQVADYPARKVTFIVGFAPGGGVDTMARIVAQELAEQFGYQRLGGVARAGQDPAGHLRQAQCGGERGRGQAQCGQEAARIGL
jgi:hypothetical protein